MECSLLHPQAQGRGLLLAKDPSFFVKSLYRLSVHTQTQLPILPETSLNKGKERYNQSQPVIHMP